MEKEAAEKKKLNESQSLTVKRNEFLHNFNRTQLRKLHVLGSQRTHTNNEHPPVNKQTQVYICKKSEAG